MRNSVNKFDNLSIEILLDIFDYLSVNDCFNAFYNLNSRINSALNSSGLSIDLTRISRQRLNEFYEKIIFSNHCRQIRKLKLSNDLTNGLLENFFTNYQLRDFKQLRSLTLIKPSYMTLSCFASVLIHLKQFEHISIDSNSYPTNFLESISTKSPSIKSCYLPGLEIEDELSFQSNIEYLTITVNDITILLNLLAVFPRLKYLNVILLSTLYIDDDECLPKLLNIISCENLQIFKLQLSEKSSIDFNEIEYIFQQTSFPSLKTFSYNCTTNSLNHIDVMRWNKILLNYIPTIEKFQFYVQILCNSYSYIDIEQVLNEMHTNLCYSFSISLSINYLYYIIHNDIYPRNHFDLSLKIFESNQCLNYDPINCDIPKKYSRVNSIILDSSSISKLTVLPEHIKYLHIQRENNHLTLKKCFENCSKQLLSLKIFGLPEDLPSMPNLKELMIQQVMFNMKMVSRLSRLCPNLELLTIEIDCIEQFKEILDQLRHKSKFPELKFIRIFSRDGNQTWSSWLSKTKQIITNDNAIYEAKNLFLFIWL